MSTSRSLTDSTQRSRRKRRALNGQSTTAEPVQRKTQASNDGTIVISVRWTHDQRQKLDAMCSAFGCDAPAVIRGAVALAEFLRLGELDAKNLGERSGSVVFSCGVYAIKEGKRFLCSALLNPTPTFAAMRRARLRIPTSELEKATSYRLGSPWKTYWSSLLAQYEAETGGGVTDFARDCLDAIATVFALSRDGYKFFVVGGGPEEELFRCLGMDIKSPAQRSLLECTSTKSHALEKVPSVAEDDAWALQN